MACIYRYQLSNKELRDNTFLLQYDSIIQSVLNNLFGINLKDCFVEEKYFQFTLYTSVSRKLLQDMGRNLKLGLSNKQGGFVRMEQTLYAIVSLQDNRLEDMQIEFIDSNLLDKPDLFMVRAQSFYQKYRNNSLYEQDYTDNSVEIINNYYIDILNAYEDGNLIRNFFGDVNDASCFFVKGYHRRYNEEQLSKKKDHRNIFLLEKCSDAEYVKNREQIKKQDDDKNDYLELYSSVNRKGHLKEIVKKLDLLLKEAENVDALSNLENTDVEYMFKVHNVGQAQAVSLAVNGESPFLYFDYGMPYGENLHTRPEVIDMITNPEITIILSHVHKDHWFRLADDFNAFQCNWFIPDQPKSVQLNHKIAEIIIHGGSVSLINRNIQSGNVRLTYGGVSRIKPSRNGNDAHETGISLRLEAYDVNGNELNILVAGDQRYDYIDSSQLKNLDMLVASHHGGKYCWSKPGYVPKANPLSSSMVIYSYGENNTHGHPSKESDYIKSGWIQSSHTTRDNCEYIIFLND